LFLQAVAVVVLAVVIAAVVVVVVVAAAAGTVVVVGFVGVVAGVVGRWRGARECKGVTIDDEEEEEN
jgi:putative effector of murein hydrolase LrgA (UPF0299 family)